MSVDGARVSRPQQSPNDASAMHGGVQSERVGTLDYRGPLGAESRAIAGSATAWTRRLGLEAVRIVESDAVAAQVQFGRSRGLPCRVRRRFRGDLGTDRPGGTAFQRGRYACLHMTQSLMVSRMLVPDVNVAQKDSESVHRWISDPTCRCMVGVRWAVRAEHLRRELDTFPEFLCVYGIHYVLHDGDSTPAGPENITQVCFPCSNVPCNHSRMSQGIHRGEARSLITQGLYLD